MFNEGFWSSLAFVVFIAAVYKPVSRMIGAALDSRAARIQEELEEAVRLREEAQALFARYQRQQSDSGKEAEEILAHAREEAERHRKHAAEAIDAALTRRERQAMDRIARAEIEAIDGVRAAAVDLAIEATRELLRERLDDDGQEALIDAAVADLDRKLH